MNLAELAIKRPTFIICIVTLMLVVGLVCLKKMPVDQYPDVTFPVAAVFVTYPGASPVDVEKQVTKPIEDELGSLAGLKTLTSNNMNSFSQIILEFKLGTDIKEAEQQIRNRLGNIRKSLPTDIEEPSVLRFDPADQPVIILSLSSSLPEGEAYDVAREYIKPQLERLGGVGKIDISGGRKTEVQVLVDKNKLQERQISLIQVANKISESSKDIPIGKTEDDKTENTLRTSGEFKNISEIGKVNISFTGSDRPVRVNDVARVVMGLEDENTRGQIAGLRTMLIQVYKQSGANTVTVTDSIINNVEKVNKFLLDKKIDSHLAVVRDMSKSIRANVDDVKESIILGILLCIVVVFLFLGSFRSTFITAMALPNSLLGGFIIMYAMGFTINIMTLLALSLAVGLLIDDAIVVRENIFRHLEMGKKPKDAAIEGTKEVALAVIATTMVVIAVFGPISFVQGIVGQFFRQFGLTVVFTMLISLFDAFTVAPMLSAYLATGHEHQRGNGFVAKILNAFDRMQTRFEDFYEKTLKLCLSYRKTVLLSAFVVFVACMALSGLIPKTFLPNSDIGEFKIKVETATGTSLEGTAKIVKKIEAVLQSEKTIDRVLSRIGSSSNEANKATIDIRLVDRKKRSQKTADIKKDFRKKIDNLKLNAKIELGSVDDDGGDEKAFNVVIAGENLEELSLYAQKLVERYKKIPGLVELDTNYRTGKPEFHVIFDRFKTESLGVSTNTAGTELRYRTEGSEVATYRQNGNDYKVRVRFDEKFRNLQEQFATTLIPNTNNNMIPLNRVAIGEQTAGYSVINRQNKTRYIQISGNLDDHGSLGTITSDVEKIFASELPPPAGITHEFKGQADDFQDLMANMMIAMGLGILFIYLVLASLYESFVTPFTILLALPLALCGAMLALFTFGKTIDIFSMIGIILLLGVVAKNSILLVDYTQHLMTEGLERNTALVKACKTRLRPILMTSLALISGMIPIAIGLNEASAQRTSMGVAIIGGILSSTILTLVVVPAAFGFVEDFKHFMRRQWQKLFAAKQNS